MSEREIVRMCRWLVEDWGTMKRHARCNEWDILATTVMHAAFFRGLIRSGR